MNFPKSSVISRSLASAAILAAALVLLILLAPPTASAADEEKSLNLGPAESRSPVAVTAAKSGQPAPSTDEKSFLGGTVEGTILPAARVRQVSLVDRKSGQSHRAAYDSSSGKFSVEKLPPGVWNIEIETPWGKVEGVDMRYRPGELAKLAPEDSKKAGAAKPGPLTDEDKAEIRRHITEVERFMKARDIAFLGDAQHASVLVDLRRDTDFHERQGDEVIWRLEVWYYQNLYGKWERASGNVVFRERLSGARFRTWTRQFDPALGGLEIAPAPRRPITVNYTVPELPSPSRGLVADGQKTAP